MKHKLLLTLGLAALALSSCSTEFIEPVVVPQPEGAIAINISGSINQEYTTRVDDGGFCNGDQVGLFGVNYTEDNTLAGELLNEGNQVDNARYTYDEANLKWVSSGSIYYKDAETNIDLYAYYPYASVESVDAYEFEVAQDQSGNNAIDGFAQSDFLWAKAEGVVPSENKVKLHFSHRLASANVVLVEGEGWAEGEFAALNKGLLVMNTKRNAEIDLSTGVATAVGDVESEGIAMKQNAEGFRAIVVPQTVAAGNALFTITVDGITHRFKHDADFTYEAGKQSKFTISIKKKSMSGELEFELLGSEITPWVADLDSHGGEARQYFVVQQDEPGTLGALIRAAKKNPAKIKNLKISGRIDANDFFFMRDSMDILQAINLKETEICATDKYAAHEIPDYAFAYNTTEGKSSLVHFVFPEIVYRIGVLSFSATSLSGALIIPADVVEIGRCAFYKTLISSIEMSNKLKVIGDAAFQDTQYLQCSIFLPDTLESIGDRCFHGSAINGEVVIPPLITKIPGECFQGTDISSIIFNDNIKIIESNSFFNSKLSGTIVLPKSLEVIEGGAFSFCDVTGELVIPKSLLSIGFQAFAYCGFTSLAFEEDSELVAIGEKAFVSNTRLSGDIVFPESLNSIANSAFYTCPLINSITLPSKLVSIGADAFNGCYGITAITCKATMPPVTGSGAFNGVAKDNFTVEVPEQSVALYQTTSGWADFKRIAAHHNFSISRQLLRTLNAEYSNTYLLRTPNGESAWSVESCPEWVTVTPSSGVGDAELTITVDELPRAEATEVTYDVWNGSNGWKSATMSGRRGEVVFLLEAKDYRSTMVVEQYDSDHYDGEVIVNQTASVGNGVNIVFMGDCFDAKDIAEGAYTDAINKAITYYFAVDPYTTYKNYFNIYTVLGVSPDSGMGSVNLVKEAKFGSQYSLDGIAPDVATTYEYAMLCDTVEEANLNQTLVVMVENTQDYGGITYMWADGSAIAICPMSADAYPFDFRGIVQHEAGGHGFGKLADEYIYHNAFIQSCTCPCCSHLDSFYAGKLLGWYRNLSTDGDYNTVEWSHLMFHPTYSARVDMYEGGYFHTRGIYRSESNSCMNNNIPYFSTISRQEMVERIMKYAGEEFTLDKFYANDNLSAGSVAPEVSSLGIGNKMQSAMSAAKQMPPKFMGEKPQLKK